MSVDGVAAEAPPAASAFLRASSRSRQVGLLPAKARRGGPPDGRSEDSVRVGSARTGTVRSVARDPRPAFLASAWAFSLASASASRCRWIAAFSSSSLDEG